MGKMTSEGNTNVNSLRTFNFSHTENNDGFSNESGDLVEVLDALGMPKNMESFEISEKLKKVSLFSNFTNSDIATLLSEENDEVLNEIYDELFKNWESYTNLVLSLAEELLHRELQGRFPEKLGTIVLVESSQNDTAELLHILNTKGETLLDSNVVNVDDFFDDATEYETLMDDIFELAQDKFTTTAQGLKVYNVKRKEH